MDSKRKWNVKVRTNRSGKLDLKGMAAEGEVMESVLSGFGIFDALEEDEGVVASEVGGDAVECAVLSEQVHQIGVRHVRSQVPNP